MAKKDTVVIIGRINVGKSTLFNRLTEEQQAIVSDVEGTTRDTNKGEVIWRGKIFTLIDSGGVNINTLKNSIGQLASGKKVKYSNSIEQEIIKQTKQAIKDAKLILFLVDGKVGILPQDKQLALVLKKINKPTLLVCNKIDSKKYLDNINIFYKLGLGDPLAVSATSGLGTGDLLDVITKKIKIKKTDFDKVEKEPINVAIIGKPNAGKSTLINTLSHKEQSIVSSIAQTTREPQDIVIKYKNNKIKLVDTAGLKKFSKLKPKSIEKDASEKTLAVIKKADVTLFILDISKNFGRQDKFLAGMLEDSLSSIIVVFNKWDKIKEKDREKYLLYYERTFPFLTWAPKLFVSAKSGLNTKKIYDVIVQASDARKIEVTENALTKFMKKLIKKHKPQGHRAKIRPYLHTLKQTNSNPPVFTLNIAKGSGLKGNYLRFMEKQIRQKFEFFACPIKLTIGKQ